MRKFPSILFVSVSVTGFAIGSDNVTIGTSPPAPPGTIRCSNCRSTSFCLDLPGGDTTNGNVLWLWDCYGGETQQWSFQDDQLVYTADPTKCVDLLGGDTNHPGTAFGIWDCNGGKSQQVTPYGSSGRIGLGDEHGQQDGRVTCMTAQAYGPSSA